MNYRQTNHNGRVSAKTGTVYNRKHNDRDFDVTHADNVHSDMVSQNIIIHYDAGNHPSVIDISNPDRISIDEHEHEIYEELFSESLGKQHARNEAARHPERNKSIDDLLNSKNTCPEETIFQIGSVEDGHPPVETLMTIFEDYQKEMIEKYGDNLHFLDAVLHLDEAVPHLHIRKVWTYHGKDGLDISQNKALTEMGFNPPDPTKPVNKWNNAKISFSEWERDMKLWICEHYGLSMYHGPKTPGKATLEKEEAIAKKLQEEIDSLSAELVTEKEKYKEYSETNIFGKPQKISVSVPDLRRWQASVVAKEENEHMQKYLKEQKELLDARERDLDRKGRDIANKRLSFDSEINKRVEKGIKERLPESIKQIEYDIRIKQRDLNDFHSKLQSRSQRLGEAEEELNRREKDLSEAETRLEKRKQSMESEIKRSVAAIIRDVFQDWFKKLKESFFKHFRGNNYEKVLTVIKDMPIDLETSNRLFKYGYTNAEHYTVGEILERSQDDDIRDALHESGASYHSIRSSDVEAVKQAIDRGEPLEDVVNRIASEITRVIAKSR
ncbi:MAG: plasmid recombination protein [Lachnospiraceae bacterium]|nr:plasmid recombination protein [Lachnospiraceae bacterium]